MRNSSEDLTQQKKVLHNITNLEDDNKFYQTLFKLHANAYLLKSKRLCQVEVTKMWNEIKNKHNFEMSDENLEAQLENTAM